MVLKRADFGKCEKSSQILLNVAYMLENGFLTFFGLVLKHFGRIGKCPKWTEFEQNPWAIAHGFEEGGFW